MSLGRPFTVLWGSNASSNLADGLAFVSIPLLAATLTDDPRWIAGLSTTYALVRLLVALPVGVWVDRIDRRSILVVANVLRGAAVLALAVTVQTGASSLLLLYVVFAIVGTLESAADNAAVSLVPAVVADRDLDRANGRISTVQIVADEFVGPPLGGFLFALAAAVPLFAMGGLWAVAGLVALALPVRRSRGTDASEPERSASMWHEATAGARWLSHHRIVGTLAVIGGLASIGYMLPFSVLVLFARDRLGVDEVGYGVILAVSALGGLVGSVSTARVRARIGYRWTIVTALLVGAASLVALALTSEPAAAAALLAAYILHAVVWGICATSLRQRLVPDALRGRVNAASRVLGLIGLAIGALLGGALATIDIAVPTFVGAATFVLCALLAASLPRGLDSNEPGPEGRAG